MALWGKWGAKKSANIQVFHYGIGSYEHFLTHVKNRKQLLEKGVDRMGDHYRRWVKMLDEGSIDEEWDRLVLNEDAIRVLSKYGVVKQDTRGKDLILPILKKFNLD